MNNKISFRERAAMENPLLLYDEQEARKMNMIGSLNDDEREFLMMKRTNIRARYHTPDPRLGDYEA